MLSRGRLEGHYRTQRNDATCHKATKRSKRDAYKRLRQFLKRLMRLEE